MIKSLGICLGASNIKTVELFQDGDVVSIGKTIIRNHESNPRAVFKEVLEQLDLRSYQFGMITGRKFRTLINSSSIMEPEAVENALDYLRVHKFESRQFSAVASLGAENFIVYKVNKENFISGIEAGNKCASGTGEFFLQQLGRMNVDVVDAVRLAENSDAYRVSGRCSVFCKSDCTHALNKGIQIGRVAAGLSCMMAEKILELLEKNEEKKILAIGGVTANPVVMNYIKERVESLYIPEEADFFEALGAAWYALRKQVKIEINTETVFKDEKTSFSYLPPIARGSSLVAFKEIDKKTPCQGDECIAGLDVGSTTTKAVIMRLSDDAVLSSVYLRTNGDPVKASRECYCKLNESLSADVNIVGLAVTGSGRHIAGLHSGSDAVINEIIAHATGAAHFDKDVDTIIEIGGQDAKYTFLTNSVPSDYAMNEACSAGTGSFLEESAKESLGIGYREIESIALKGQNPPDFNDQCAAFISSDIKTATHEGIGCEDIVAGLVYSICMNYVNRVKGQRPVGKKIFMQGGVCYNKAIPMAMANLLEREIVVPPDPGLMGAFGVALELKHRIENGAAQRSRFDLKELAEREISYGKSFLCKGEGGLCDRACEISIIIIDGLKFPFGGACNRYYNRVHKINQDTSSLDFIKYRQNKIFECVKPVSGERKRVGISRSYFTNTFLPLYNTFFNESGFDVVLSDEVDPEGIKRRRSSFCYPGEIAHGCFSNLLKKEIEYIFLPKILGLHVENSVNTTRQHQATCVLLQSEAYYLKSAFRDLIKQKILSPILDFSNGFDSQEKIMVEMAFQMGVDKEKAANSWRKAVEVYKRSVLELKKKGAELIENLEKDSSKIAIVLFGRAYNAFAHEAHMGIPEKFASRGIMIIPWDILQFENEECDKDMCWAIGQNLLKTAAFVKKHPQLFGTWVTNFSCGPDSFLVGNFRDIMKTKPSLTLELDSHTADAGVNTRIEAFVDIVQRWRILKKKDPVLLPFQPAMITFKKGIPWFVSSRGEEVSFLNKRVHLLIPSMGRLLSEIAASAFKGLGVNASAVPVYDFEDLKMGRANSSCKECLPLQLTAGALVKHLHHRTVKDELLAYFMVFTPGNCRFPQYRVFLNNYIKKNQIPDVSLFSLTAEKGYLYQAFSGRQRLQFLKGFIISDVMEDIRNALIVMAVDQKVALETYEKQWCRIRNVFERGQYGKIYKVLESVALELSKIPRKFELNKAKKVSLMGEIFVRRDYFSCQDLMNRLQNRGFVVKKAHFFEWFKYVDRMIEVGVYEPGFDLKGAIQFKAKLMLQKGYERKIKRIFEGSGLYEYEFINIDEILQYGKNFFDIEFRGESILVVGDFFRDILHTTHGVVSLGPFACMPTRVIEAVLSAEATMDNKKRLDEAESKHVSHLDKETYLPFLPVETDGNPFPQIVEARIEAFCLQVERLHEALSGKE